MNIMKIKEDILNVWDHAGLDNEMDARLLAKELNKDPILSKAGARNGRQLQHAQIGQSFGREGVLGAISNNIDDISVGDIASKNNVAAKKINAGWVTRIVYSLISNDSKNALWFPVMWKPIINYFLGKLFGDRSITLEQYHKGIKGTLINETTMYKIDKQLILESFSSNFKDKLKSSFKDAKVVAKDSFKQVKDDAIGEAKNNLKGYSEIKKTITNLPGKALDVANTLGQAKRSVTKTVISTKKKIRDTKNKIQDTKNAIGEPKNIPEKIYNKSQKIKKLFVDKLKNSYSKGTRGQSK